MSFNTIKSTSKKIDGSHHIWHEVNRRLVSGGTLSPLPKAGTLIPAGTPVNIPNAGGSATLLEVYEVAANVTATDTEVKIVAGAGLPVPTKGGFMMITPKEATSTGKGVEALEVDFDSTQGVYVVTIAANDFGILKAGDLLVDVDKSGTGAKMKAIPNALVWNDVYISQGVTAATVAGVVSGIVYADRITPVPSCIKALLPQITFEVGI